MLFNAMVLCYNEHYREAVRTQDRQDMELRNRGGGSARPATPATQAYPEPMASVGGVTVHSVSTDQVNVSINPMEAAKTASAIHAATNGAWKKEYDPVCVWTSWHIVIPFMCLPDGIWLEYVNREQRVTIGTMNKQKKPNGMNKWLG
jgi:hypothetical protein